jgi:hypothetical protein
VGKRWSCILLASGVVLCASSKNAATTVGWGSSTQKTYRVVYDVPDGCPHKQDFVRYIEQRAGNHWRAAQAQASGTIAVEISSSNGRFEGNLVCVSRKGTVSRRTLEQTDCEQAVLDMAVMAVACIQSDTDPPPLALELGAAVGANWTTGPHALGVAGLMGIRWPGSQFSLMAMAEYSDTGTTHASDSPEVPLRFRLPALRVDACFVEPTLGDALSFPLCAEVAAGYLYVRLDEPASAWQQRPWATLGVAPHMRFTFRPFFFQLGPHLGLFLGKRMIQGTLANEGMTSATRWQHDIPIMSLGFLFRAGVTF